MRTTGARTWFQSLALTLVIAPVGAQQDTTKKPATGIVTGRVVDALGKPVPAAEVWVTEWRDGTRRLGKTWTDGEGMFVLSRLPLSDKLLRVQSTAPDHIVADDGVRVSRLQPRDTAYLQLWDAARLRGRVIDEAGKPIAGALVVAAFDYARLFGLEPQGKGVTDKNGTFLLPKIPLGEIHVRAVAPGRKMALEVIYLTKSAEVQLKLVKGVGVRITVQVNGVSAEKSAKARIRVLPYYRGSHMVLPASLVSGKLDKAGRWSAAGMPNLEYQVSIYGDGLGYRFKPRTHRCKEGGKLHEIVFEATPLGTTVLRGTLKDAKGTPLAGETVVARVANSLALFRAVTQADGSFEIQSPTSPGEKCRLSVVGSRWVLSQDHDPRDRRTNWTIRNRHEHVCTADPDEPVDLRAVVGSRVHGRVVHKDGERPAPLVRVQLEHERSRRTARWAPIASATSNSAGHFVFRALPHAEDQLRVRVVGRRGAGISDTFQIAESEDTRDIEVTLSPPGIVEGLVKDGNGEPIPGARVWLRDWDSEGNTQRSFGITEVLTDRRGRYRFVGVEPGGHYLDLHIRGNRMPVSTGRGKDTFDVGSGQRVVKNLDG